VAYGVYPALASSEKSAARASEEKSVHMFTLGDGVMATKRMKQTIRYQRHCTPSSAGTREFGREPVRALCGGLADRLKDGVRNPKRDEVGVVLAHQSREGFEEGRAIELRVRERSSGFVGDVLDRGQEAVNEFWLLQIVCQ
jgi:hypothetical protein